MTPKSRISSSVRSRAAKPKQLARRLEGDGLARGGRRGRRERGGRGEGERRARGCVCGGASGVPNAAGTAFVAVPGCVSTTSMARLVEGLIVDYGGVLTTDVFASFRAFCEAEGLAPETVRDRFLGDPEARGAARAPGDRAAARGGVRAGVRRGAGGLLRSGLIDRLFGGMETDEAMVAGVRAARRAGVRTAMLSNSWGEDRYDRAAARGAVRRLGDLRRGRPAQARPGDLRARGRAARAPAGASACSSTTCPATSSRRGRSGWRRSSTAATRRPRSTRSPRCSGDQPALIATTPASVSTTPSSCERATRSASTMRASTTVTAG